jgi:gluconate 5-dehydrogenase
MRGKRVVVTGATTGIGRVTAIELGRMGAEVVIVARDREKADATLAEVRAAGAPSAQAILGDLSLMASVRAVADEARGKLDRIDVLVNNAGISPARVTVADMTLEFWRKVFAVNLEGPLRMSQCVAPVMRDQGGGSIVNIATMGAYSGGSTVCAYGASKAGLVNLTKSMAQEWAPWNVRVNVLSPGPFMTEMLKGGARTMPGYEDQLANGTLQQRVADPREIVGPVLYLASDASSFVTGDDISVSGGMPK